MGAEHYEHVVFPLWVRPLVLGFSGGVGPEFGMVTSVGVYDPWLPGRSSPTHQLLLGARIDAGALPEVVRVCEERGCLRDLRLLYPPVLNDPLKKTENKQVTDARSLYYAIIAGHLITFTTSAFSMVIPALCMKQQWQFPPL